MSYDKSLQPNQGRETVDRDPTVSIQRMQKSLINEQGGTVFTGVADRARGKHRPDDGTDGNHELLQGDLGDGFDYYTPGEWQSRNFGPDDNVTPQDGDYGDFFI